MNKLNPKINQKKARSSATSKKGPHLGAAMDYCENEISPILQLLHGKETPEIIKKSFKRFLIISLVSAFEFYFKNMAAYYVDKNSVDLTRLFKNELCFKLSDLDSMLKGNLLTRGNIVNSSVNFDDLNQINSFVSKLLNINFFKYLYEENSRDKCKMMIRNAPPIDINYKNLLEAFELRHEVVHELAEVSYSYSRIVHLWDNAMNIFDIANTIFVIPELLEEFRQEYGQQSKS
jgi:hypothetical protein